MVSSSATPPAPLAAPVRIFSLLAVLVAGSRAADGAAAPLTFTVLTEPLPLLPGEVTNTWHRLTIPAGPIAISELVGDVVEMDPATGEVLAVPLSDAYVHHQGVYSERKYHEGRSLSVSAARPGRASRGVGFGAGSESRGTRQAFPFPYRFTTARGEDELIANVHVINTRTMSTDQAHRCLECPCTAEDRVAPSPSGEQDERDGKESSEAVEREYGTALLDSVVDRGYWDRCNSDLMLERNTACFPETYHGGLICCEHGDFCLDDYFPDESAQTDNSTQSIYYVRYTLAYTPMTPDIKPLYLAACCDASGDLTSPGNIEYDVPKLCDGPFDGDQDDEYCVHKLETVQMLHGPSRGPFGTGGAEREEDAYVDVVYMVGHLHRGGISITARLEGDGSLLCESLPTYGTGAPGEIGNEPGYVNSMSACAFDPPLRMRTTDGIRVVARYNATEAHTGVMSLFYIAVSDATGVEGVEEHTTEGEEPPPARVGGFLRRFQPLAVLLAAGIVVGASVARRMVGRQRSGYESLPGSLSLSV